LDYPESPAQVIAILGLALGIPAPNGPTCETCGKEVREGLLYCSGLSECWWKGKGLR